MKTRLPLLLLLLSVLLLPVHAEMALVPETGQSGDFWGSMMSFCCIMFSYTYPSTGHPVYAAAKLLPDKRFLFSTASLPV